MQYMFLIYGSEAAIAASTESEMAESVARNQAVIEKASAEGALVGVGALLSTSNATTVRLERGIALTTDGPFAETKEQLGGYYILECKDLDEAIAWAEQMPACGGGCIEIRPMMELPG
ncbi:MAG: YciI family protein [Bryobacteraceae bacterium]